MAKHLGLVCEVVRGWGLSNHPGVPPSKSQFQPAEDTGLPRSIVCEFASLSPDVAVGGGRETEPDWEMEIAGDTKEECAKFGSVLHLHVDRDSKASARTARFAAVAILSCWALNEFRPNQSWSNVVLGLTRNSRH